MAGRWPIASVVGVFKLVRDFSWYGVDKIHELCGGEDFSAKDG